MLAQIAFYVIIFIAVIYILTNVGDFFQHIIDGLKPLRNNNRALPKNVLDAKPPRLFAIAVAAWRENNILTAAIDNLFASTQYPNSMFHVFLGIHSNDAETVSCVGELMKRHPNLHIVMNPQAGPTSKEDNLNNIIRFIKSYERQNGYKFCGVVIHNANDVVHPYELKTANYLIDEYQILQFPVRPVQEMPNASNLYRNFTVGTYADEFAERDLSARRTNKYKNGVVSLCGVGTVLSGDVLDYYGVKDVIPENGLYSNTLFVVKMSLAGFKTHYVSEYTERLSNDGKMEKETVAIRVMFPSRFTSAVEQKARWYRSMRKNSPRTDDVFMKGLSFAQRHALFCSYTNGLNNILTLPAYAVMTWFIISLVGTISFEFVFGSFSWWACVVLCAIILQKQIRRAIAIYRVYGIKSATVALLFPPILPQRLIYGAFINLCAALKTSAPDVRKADNINTGKEVGAAIPNDLKSNGHQYLDQQVLNRYYRNLGDVLLEKDFVSPDTLKWALDISKEQDRLVGEVLLHGKKISEEHLMRALASVKHTLFVPELRGFICKEYTADWDKKTLESFIALPILKIDDGYVVAIADESPQSTKLMLELKYGKHIFIVYSTRSLIRDAINAMYSPTFRGVWKDSSAYKLFTKGKITWEQAILTRIYQSMSLQSTDEMLSFMGLKAEKDTSLAEKQI